MTNPIIYRDLKLENLLLASDGHIKITDFGLCKILNQEQPSTTTFCGTPEYLAPEILEDNQYGLPVDWWSLGVVLHEMIVGRLPFHSWRNHEDLYEAIINDPLPELPPRVPYDASQLLHGLLMKRPEERLGGRMDAQEVMDHVFFRDIDFAALERKEIRPEWVPVLRSQDDVSHFPTEFTQQPIPNISEAYSVTSHDFDNEFRSFEYNNEHNRSLQDPRGEN
jgi:serine/threonine protein kinase